MNKQILTTVLTLSSLILPLSAEASSFTKLNVFGDSLVETGNLFNATGLPPSPPYFKGRFANDEIWVDTLAKKFNLNPILSSKLELGVTTIPNQGINFAFSGATTGASNTGSDLFPGLQQQIDSFRNLTAIAPADANALNIIWAGANDYLQAFSAPDRLTVPPAELPEQATNNLSKAVRSLYEVGAKNFLVVNLPDLGETPFANFLNESTPGTVDRLNTLTGVHNLLLEQKLSNLDTSLAGIDLKILDANSLFRDIINEPSQFGFTNIDSSCLLNFQPLFNFDGMCSNPNEFVFWDRIHPTGAVHQLVAQNALETLEQKERIPEPSNIWSLLLFASLALSWFNICKYRLNK